MTTTTTIAHLVLLALVTVYLPLSVVSMDTENGYLCNLCHSLQNEFPYPPPDAEPKVVRFTQLQNEQFGLPWDRGVTCLDVWNIVLDYANPNVQDEASCRSMAAAYAPQCCHHITDDDEPESHRLAQQQQENNNEGGDIQVVAARVDTIQAGSLSFTLTEEQRFRERESHSSGGSERSENNVRRTAASISFLRGDKTESAPRTENRR